MCNLFLLRIHLSEHVSLLFTSLNTESFPNCESASQNTSLSSINPRIQIMIIAFITITDSNLVLFVKGLCSKSI